MADRKFKPVQMHLFFLFQYSPEQAMYSDVLPVDDVMLQYQKYLTTNCNNNYGGNYNWGKISIKLYENSVLIIIEAMRQIQNQIL
jgi:hypothetical protein